MLAQDFTGEELSRWAEGRYGSRTAGASALALKLHVERRRVARWLAGRERIPDYVRERILSLAASEMNAQRHR